MKIKIYFISALLLLSSASCTNWLDVTPKDTIDEDDFFKVGTGYRNALNGAYKQMSSTSLYGRELSWGLLDALGQCYIPYSLETGHPYYIIANEFEYKDVKTKPYFEAIWTKAYNTIANCNNLIGRIVSEDNHKFKGGEVEKNMILGEAIALRAFMHFDILRLFAAAPIMESKDLYIPYYESYPNLGEPNMTTDVVLEKVIRDLKEARAMVEKFDLMDAQHIGWLHYNRRFTTNAGSSSVYSSDIFYTHRGYRMNYYAITAVLARAYNYARKYDLAAEEAQNVIDAKDNMKQSLFEFTPKSDVIGNRKLSHDVIFSLSYLKLYDDYRPYYIGDKTVATPLYINRDITFDDSGDYRLLLIDPMSYYKTSNKNVAPISTNADSKMVEDMLPIIRMSELYFIIAEKHANDGNFVAATTAIDMVRMGRNCTKGNLHITNYKSFVETLLSEIKREYFGEGQVFHYYKKYNTLLSYSMSEENFIIPRPESENIN